MMINKSFSYKKRKRMEVDVKKEKTHQRLNSRFEAFMSRKGAIFF
jgi:hypothetical protein